MSTYKLYYFPFPGRGELIRYIFAQAGVEYEDYHVQFEKWMELKPTMPFGWIPVLEVDGKKLSSTSGIARFLAERFGLAGSNDVENAEVFAIVDAARCLFDETVKVLLEKDETKKASIAKNYLEKVFPGTVSNFERMASENGTPEGWVYGKKVTYADLLIYDVFAIVLKEFPNILDGYPTMTKLKSSVEQLPNIAKWLKERPEPVYPPSFKGKK